MFFLFFITKGEYSRIFFEYYLFSKYRGNPYWKIHFFTDEINRSLQNISKNLLEKLKKF